MDLENTNKLTIGILAHVDAGKTTLAESILYLTGSIRKLGRVDHQDAFLDTYELERERGITIFSKQAEFRLGEREVTLLDTPGHVDFSAEMERTLQVLDYAILVISGADGVQGHVQTLWRLLKQYEIPVFLFINKMDQPDTNEKALMEELTKRLDEKCINFSGGLETEEAKENLAVCDEAVLEHYLESGEIQKEEIINLIAKRKVFPCYFGSALKIQGVEEFLRGIETFTRECAYPEEFGARVFKIARDAQRNRLTYLKITGGSLKVKMLLSNEKEAGEGKEELWEEKAEQIRIYSGNSFEAVKEAKAGSVCAVTGLSHTYCGQGLGIEAHTFLPVLEPVLTYKIELPEDCNVHSMLIKLKELEEEEPQLHIVWDERLQEIHAQVMGEVQIEILKRMIWERYQTEVEFGSGKIVYKETIEDCVEGVGHFEPLRHYAEVHLKLEPAERGTGLHFFADCSEDLLDRNWQRLVLTHLEERMHKGVLTGSEITDMRITLVSGRAHLKHTEGGDFRQATYRALRQGLKKAKSVLLEPVYEFRLELPADKVGRAMADIQKMYGEFQLSDSEGEYSVVTGFAPVSLMRDYQKEVMAYTSGHGRLFCTLKGYMPCHNADEVIEEMNYDSESDLENPTGSVFCAHGAGFIVPWYEVEDYMHLELQTPMQKQVEEEIPMPKRTPQEAEAYLKEGVQNEEELRAIFERTYGAVKRERQGWERVSKRNPNRNPSVRSSETENTRKEKKREPIKEYLLVDGYNIIFAWEDLNELSKINIESARNKLMDRLSNYQGYKKMTLILVFDAYKVKGNPGSVMKYHNIYVVYTKEAETADQYIEKTVHEIGRKYQVTVATSDALEQVIILGQGGNRLSAANLLEEVEAVEAEISKKVQKKTSKEKNYLFDHLDEEMADLMEEVRLGKKKLQK
ncbi:NYN domain-containing protein [Blautia stercoris]|uniref:NYN domain-containing protein n=1 Tax=Blautia stercoris TaxID=871664 RepID=UPI00355B12B7